MWVHVETGNDLIGALYGVHPVDTAGWQISAGCWFVACALSGLVYLTILCCARTNASKTAALSALLLFSLAGHFLPGISDSHVRRMHLL